MHNVHNKQGEDMGWKENKTAYNIKYAKDKLKRVPLDLKLEDYDKLKAHAETMHETVNGFIKRAINETISNDTKTP